MLTYIHAYIQAGKCAPLTDDESIIECIHTYIHTYIHTCMHTYRRENAHY